MRPLLLAVALISLVSAAPEPRPRIRDLGVRPGIFSPGPLNAILPHGGNLFQQKVQAGDFAIAFSTRNPIPFEPKERLRTVEELHNDAMSPLFLAAVEAVEEAVYNSLTRATDVTGHQGHKGEAISIPELRRVLGERSVVGELTFRRSRRGRGWRRSPPDLQSAPASGGTSRSALPVPYAE